MNSETGGFCQNKSASPAHQKLIPPASSLIGLSQTEAATAAALDADQAGDSEESDGRDHRDRSERA
jgi:hypothetical protein